jgi:dUTP pyrophosphatase
VKSIKTLYFVLYKEGLTMGTDSKKSSNDIEVTDWDKTDTEKHVEHLETMQDNLKQIFKEQYCIQVEVLPDGALPFKAHATDAGFDLIATDTVRIHPGTIVKHPLNIKMKLPRACWAEITGRSGLGAKGLLVYSGVIDEGYRGVPHVIMTNLNHRDGVLTIEKGQKISQLLMHPYSPNYYIERVESVLNDTDRGEGGFGSTDK